MAVRYIGRKVEFACSVYAEEKTVTRYYRGSGNGLSFSGRAGENLRLP